MPLSLLSMKTLRNGERLEMFEVTLHTQSVYRLVWSDRHGVKGAKPRNLDIVDYTRRSDASERFLKAR